MCVLKQKLLYDEDLNEENRIRKCKTFASKEAAN